MHNSEKTNLKLEAFTIYNCLVGIKKWPYYNFLSKKIVYGIFRGGFYNYHNVNMNGMKFFTTILFIAWFLMPAYVLGQAEKPTATIVSVNDAYCESGSSTFKIVFTGVSPFSFDYDVGPFFGFKKDNIGENTFEMTISPTETSIVTLTKVYDNNYQRPSGGSTEVFGSVEIRVDEMPKVNAGSDNEVCGYEYDMVGAITGTTTNLWWSKPGDDGSFNDSTILNAKFNGTTAGKYKHTLIAENGTCRAQDEVDITLKGRPKGEITNADNWQFCSTDGNTHELPIEVSFDGSGDFTYFLKDEDEKKYGPFSPSSQNDNQLITVSKKNAISFHSIEDGQGCSAVSADMKGSRTAIDVKPNVFAGDDVTANCGPEYILKAAISEATSGKWTSLTTGIAFADSSQHNSLIKATFENETTKDVKLRWTETTTDTLACASYDELNIKFIQAPALTLKSLSSEQICEDKSTTLSFDVKGNAPWIIDYNLGGISSSKTLTLTDKKLTVLGSDPDFAIGDNTIGITKIKDRFNCESALNLTQNVLVDQMPMANAGPDQDVCGVLVNLEAIPDFQQGEWMLSEGSFNEKSDPNTTFTANDFGILNLYWKERNGVCVDKDTVQISFFAAPYPLKDDTMLVVYAADSVKLNASVLTVGTGQWSILEPAITGAFIVDSDSYNTSLTNLNGKEIYKLEWKAIFEAAPEQCREKNYNVIIDSRPMLAPTGFSPDGNWVNDEFFIRGAKESSRLTVFNKHGKLVFKTDEFSDEYKWKGTDQSGAKLPPDTYLYVYQDTEVTIKNYLIIKY